MDSWDVTRTDDEKIDAWQTELLSCEAQVTRIRARQVELIRRLDRYQVDTADGARTMGFQLLRRAGGHPRLVNEDHMFHIGSLCR